MARFLKNINDVKTFMAAVAQCKGDVYLVKDDQSEEFNLKSELSEFLGIARLAEERGDRYEIFCQLPQDESILIKYFYERKND